MPILKLIRFPNLVIVAFTQCLLYYCILLPPFDAHGIIPDLDQLHFHLFVLVTIIITAGGYIVNDLIDYEVDLINKPEKVYVRQHLSLPFVHWFYFLIHLLGLFLSIYLALYVKDIRLAIIFPFAVLGLFGYSRYLKGHTILGNLVVSTYCAGVAWIIWFSQKTALAQLATEKPNWYFNAQLIFWWYVLFAFLATFFREIVKDIEDMDGDRAAGLRTSPIAWGLGTAKVISSLLGIALLLAVLFLAYQHIDLFQIIGQIFLFCGLILPIALALFLLWKAKTKRQYHQLSQLAKWIMAAGVLLLLFLNPLQ